MQKKEKCDNTDENLVAGFLMYGSYFYLFAQFFVGRYSDIKAKKGADTAVARPRTPVPTSSRPPTPKAAREQDDQRPPTPTAGARELDESSLVPERSTSTAKKPATKKRATRK